MSITLQEAKNLYVGQVLHHDTMNNADGSPLRVRVNGEVKTWKRNSERIRVPLKHGLYEYGELTNGTYEGANGFTLNLKDVSIPED